MQSGVTVQQGGAEGGGGVVQGVTLTVSAAESVAAWMMSSHGM